MKKLTLLNLLLATIVLTLGMASCGSSGTVYSAEVNGLDTTITSLENAKKSILDIDSSAFTGKGTTLRDHVKFVQEFYNDTMPREEGFLMSDYGSIAKSFRRFTAKRGKLLNQINFTLTQMKQLREDLNNNVVSLPDTTYQSSDAEMERNMSDAARAKHYCNVETMEAKQLIEDTKKFVTGVENTTKTFNDMNPKVEALVEKLKNELEAS